MEEKDIVTCEYCGHEADWNNSHIFYCEKCSKLFCTNCFIDRVSWKDWVNNMNNDDLLCPDCYRKEDSNGYQLL